MAKKATNKAPAKRGQPTKYTKTFAANWLKHVESGMGLIEASHKMGITHDALLDWIPIHSDIKSTHKKAKEIVENRIITSADAGQMNPAWAMFRLKCNHGYVESDKQQNIDIKREELAARIAGDVNDEKEIKISFTEAVKD